MAVNKEAIAIVVDVGSSMNQAVPGEETSLRMAIEAITMILQRKMFSESKDELALVLFGTTETDNPLADGECYENISIRRPLGIADFEFLEMVQTDIQPSSVSADFIDALIVALDHLEQGILGKHGFACKRLILLSDLAGPFGDDQLDRIINAIRNSNTEVNIIGPDLDEEDGHDDGRTGHQKEKTPQQRAGEAMAKYILEQVKGESYSFREALPVLSYFQSRQVRPTAWKCQMEIGPDLKIPINGYIKIKEYKLKQSWKKVYAKDPDKAVETSRTYHINDEEETEVDREDVVEGYCYGSDRIPMSAEDKESMKYRAEKCFKVLGFTKAENVKRHHYMGDSVLSITAEKGDEPAAVALSAIINALYETNYVAIARRVYDARSSPRIGCLIPHIKANQECLHWIELPFSEDLRTFTFGSLPVRESSGTRKHTPSQEQLAAVDELIASLDLTTGVRDENGETWEASKPKLTFNPYFQRVYQCLQHRALQPDETLPELSPLIARCLQPQLEVANAAHVEKLCRLFTLETAGKRKDRQTGESMFRKDAGDGLVTRPKTDNDDLSGGLENITRPKVTEVGTVTPVEDFQDLCSRKDKDFFEEACHQMQDRVQQIVTDSFGQQLYGKAVDCLGVFRQECIKKLEPRVYNKFIQEFKKILSDKGRQDFWDRLLEERLSLITKVESEESDVSKEEADTFMAGQVLRGEVTAPQEDDTTDDLLMDL